MAGLLANNLLKIELPATCAWHQMEKDAGNTKATEEGVL